MRTGILERTLIKIVVYSVLTLLFGYARAC